VPPAAWAADETARARGRVAVFNAVRPDGLDGGWTMDERIWRLLRDHVLTTIDELADEDGTVALRTVVDLAQQRYATHELFPKGRVRNDVTYTKVDLEARCEVERVPGRSPQRIMRWRPDPEG
jgi:hypothetical protein